jgi:hypothetical protein
MKDPGAGLEQLDRRLASLARGEAAWRLRLGQALEMLGRGGVFELGFSSLAAYAVERCERSVRWVEGARCLARRVELLPQLREAIAFGRVSWSMAEALTRVVTPENEARWIEQAESRTVRQMRRLAKESVASCAGVVMGPHGTAGVGGGAAIKKNVTDEEHRAWTEDEHGLRTDEHWSSEGPCTLTCTVATEDAWLFEATRHLLEHLGVCGADAQSEALLAEAQATLLAQLPADTFDSDRDCDVEAMQRRWAEALAQCRADAEALCERNVLGCLLASRAEPLRAGGARSAVAVSAARGIAGLESSSPEALDRQVRALARALARQELELSSLALAFHRANGWRRLGYATEAQYARERLGISRSSLLARRRLGACFERLPGVAAALGAGQLGIEAASQVVRVARPGTEAAWVERARRRTIKHLKEEVAAALTAVRCSGELNCPPPLDEEIADFQRLEQAVVSGRIGLPQPVEAPRVTRADGSAPGARRLSAPESGERRAWLVMLGSLASWLDSGFQMSAAVPTVSRTAARAGRVTLRLRMSPGNAAWWRSLEARAAGSLPRGVSWLRFLCLSVWQAWRHLLGAEVAYGHIYVRDRFRCMSPVCNRRDVTPHHLRFRSAGGSDDDDNIGSLCLWCHLHGVHGGRIRARGPAWRIRWELGARGSPCVVVEGRERISRRSCVGAAGARRSGRRPERSCSC